jgi:signal transduction histidine kinase
LRLPQWPVSSLRVYLVLVIVAATVPLALFALVMLHEQSQTLGADRQASLYRLANAMSLALEREFASSQQALALIARDEALQRGDIAQFRRNQQRWPLPRPSWQALVLADAQGRALYSSAGDEAQLPTLPPAATPHVSDLLRVGEGWVAAVELPLQIGSRRFLLAALIGTRQWQQLVDQAAVAGDRFVSVVDGAQRVVALSQNPGRWTGRMLRIERQAQLLREPEAASWSGPRSQEPLVTLKEVGRSGWWVGAGTTQAPGGRAEAAVLSSTMIAALASLAVGIGLALVVARRVSRPLRHLAQGSPQAAEETIVVREIAQLREALAHADREREDAMRALQAKADEYQALLQERLALVQREQEARRSAEQASRGKDEFLAMLGHELRNPLSAISAAVEVINRVDPQHPSSHSARRIIARQTQQLVGLMNDLMDMARASAGKIKLARQPLNLARLVWRTHAALRLGGQFRQQALVLSLDEVWADVDPMRIEQVVSNLLTNAAKYTPPDGVIAVTLRLQDGQAALIVEDTGMGIPAALLPRVFDVFVQGELALDRRQGGLGLGLTLVRRLVELHGGSVHASSDGSGRGSRFTVLLQAQRERPTLPVQGRPLTLVGFDESVLAALEALLELRGPRRVVNAPTAEALLACLQRDPTLHEAVVVVHAAALLSELPIALSAWRAMAPRLRLVALVDADAALSDELAFDAQLVAPLTPQELQLLLAPDDSVAFAS